MHAPSSASSDTLVGGLAQAFPENSTKLDSGRFDLRYQYSAALSLHLRYAYEKYDMNDWALAGVGTALIPNMLTIGRDPYHHDVNLFGLTAQYRFGSGGAPRAKAE